MRRRISIRGCVRPSVRVSVRPWVRGSVSIKEKRGLGASYVGYPNLFLQQLNSIVLCQIYHHILFFSGLSDTTVTLVLCQGAEKDLSLSFTFNALPFYYDRYFFLGLIWKSLIYSCQNQERRVLQNPRWRWDKKRRKRRKKNINDSDFNRESAPFM